MFYRALYVFIGLILFCTSLSAQEYSFRTYSVAEGLPQSQVTCITQDKQGFLWVGTLGGLARFSGREFEAFSVDQGLLNNRISSLAIIGDTLWVGHENGVSYEFNNQFVALPIEKIKDGGKVSSILFYKGNYFFGVNGSGLFRFSEGKIVQINPTIHGISNRDEFERIRDMVLYDSKMYVATRTGIFYSHDGFSFHLVPGSEEYSFSSLKIDPLTNQLFASSYGDGVFHLENEELKPYMNSASLLGGNFKHLFIDHTGKIWLSTKFNGAVRIDEKENLHLHTSNGLPMENISCVFEDNTHGIWLGTEGKGLVHFSGEAFTFYTTRSGLNSDLIVSVAQDKEQNIWFGSYANGVSQKTKSGWRNYDDRNGLSNNTVWAVATDKKNQVWFATADGLNRFEKDHFIPYFQSDYPSLPGDKIMSLFLDSHQRFWVGGQEGAAYFENDSVYPLSKLISQSANLRNVRDFAEYDGQLFMASQTGIHVLTASKVLLSYPISENQPGAYSIEADKLGNIWIGTEEGVYLFRDGVIRQLNYSDFSGSNFAVFIQKDGDNMWVGTNNGLFRFTPKSGDWNTFHVEQFGIFEGLVSLETNINSSLIDQEGNLWFGTSEGLMKFDKTKENVFAKTIPPILSLHSVLVNFQPYEKPMDTYNPVRFSHSQNRFIFNFKAVTLAFPEDIKFQYLIEGLNEDWSPLSKVDEISISGLVPGDYRLRVRAVSKTGIYSNEVNFPFVILPPFYTTWWFISLGILLTGSLVLILFRFKLKQERSRREQERLVFTSRLRDLEQQSLNASMNRHFIFNALNSIQYFINTQDRLSANKYLSQFAKLIRKNLDSSSTDQNMVTLSEEIERLKLYLSLESMRFRDRFDYEFTIDPSIDTEAVKVPSMIFQPFVENSIIHGILPRQNTKGEIHFSAHKNAETIDFIIEDNGVGYEKSIKQKQGDGDHQSRGMSITSSRIELLQKISGKSFLLIGPNDIKNDTGESIGTRVHIKIPDNSLED